MTKRNLLRLVRTPQVFLFAVIQPLFLLVVFVFVFGGSIETDSTDYINFVFPGILIQTLAFAGGNSAIRVARDLEQGATDRFRSLPIKAASILLGRTAADLVESLITATTLVVVGYVIGFRFSQGLFLGVAALALALLFGFTFSWIFMAFAVWLKDLDKVNSVLFIPPLLITFAASTFVPVDDMPEWLQVFASRQPVTHTVDAIRGLTDTGLPVARPLLFSLIWIAGILATCIPLSTWLFYRE